MRIQVLYLRKIGIFFVRNISGPCLALVAAVEDGGGEEKQPEAEQEAEAVHQAAWASMRSLSDFVETC